MPNRKLYSLICLIFLILNSCDKVNSSQDLPIDDLSNSLEIDNILEYQLPDQWFVYLNHGTPASLVIVDTVEQASVNFLVEPAPLVYSSNIDSIIYQMNSYSPELKVLAYKEFDIDNEYAFQINFEKESNEFMNFSTVQIHHPDFLITLTLTCAKPNYESGLKSLGQLLKSIRFKEDKLSLESLYIENKILPIEILFL